MVSFISNTRGADERETFTTRTADAARRAAEHQDGAILRIGGLLYRKDGAATISATADLGIAGLVPARIATPAHFGATGAGDDGPALQRFFDAIAQTEFVAADMSGSFGTAQALRYGTPGDTPATKRITGRMVLSAMVPIDAALLTVENGALVEWDSLDLRGTGGTAWSSRGCRIGLRTINCGRQAFRRVGARDFTFAGICCDGGNNSLSQFGDVKVTDCGSGKAGYSVTGIWSNPVNSGSQGSASQRTTIDVDQMPPGYVLNGDHGPIGDAPFYVRIDGRLHFIYAADAIAGTLTVYPWVASTATPGLFEYVFGGGVYLRGADCNVQMFQSIDAIRCGAGLVASSLYGPQANRIVTQLCGVGLLVGRQPAGASLGGKYQNIYFENNDEDIVFAMRTGSNAYNYFDAEYALDLDLVYCAGAPRLADDSISASFEPLQFQELVYRGERLHYEKPSRSATSSGYALTPTRRDEHRVIERDTLTLDLQPLDMQINRITGVDSLTAICLGSGGNAQPTGTITVNAPAGWTINGGPGPIILTTLAHPPVLVMQWQIGALDVVLSHTNGAAADHVADATAGSAAEINALRDALVTAGLMRPA